MIKRLLALSLLLFLFSGSPVFSQGLDIWEFTNWPIFQYVDEQHESFSLVPTGIDEVIRDIDVPVKDGSLPITADWDLELAGSLPPLSGAVFDIYVKTSNASATVVSDWQLVIVNLEMPRGFSSGVVIQPIPATIYIDAVRPYLRSIRFVAHIDSDFSAEGCFPVCDIVLDMVRLSGALAATPTPTATATATLTPTFTPTPVPTLTTGAVICNSQFLITAFNSPYTSSSSGGGGGAAAAFDNNVGTYWQGTEAQNVEALLTAGNNPNWIYGFAIQTFAGVSMTVRIEDVGGAVLMPSTAVNQFWPSDTKPSLFYLIPGGPVAIPTGIKVFAKRTNDFNPHLISVLGCTLSEPLPTPTPTVTPTTICGPLPTPGAGTPTVTSSPTPGAGTPTVTPRATCAPTMTPTNTVTPTGTSTASMTPTPTATSLTPSATPTPVPPPGGTLPPPGGGTPGAPPVVPTPVVALPTVTFSDPFGDAVSPCIAPASSTFLFTNFACPAYQFPAWPGFTIQVWVYFSYVVQSVLAIYGSLVCFFGSIFNWFVFVINWLMVGVFLGNYFFCMVAEFFRLLGVFLGRAWSLISAFAAATSSVGAPPTTFLGMSLTPVLTALATMLSNSYIGSIASLLFGLVTFAMWRHIVVNISGGSDE